MSTFVSSQAQSAIRTLMPLIGYLRGVGVDVEALLAEVGISSLSLLDASARISNELMLELWRQAERRAGDPLLGLRVIESLELRPLERLQHETEAPVPQLFVVSATVGEGLRRVARYFPVGFDGSQVSLEQDDDEVRVRHVAPSVRALPRSFAEFILGLIARQLREFPVRPVRPARVLLTHAAPPSPSLIEEHRRMFGAQVDFAAPEDALLLSAADLEVPLRAPNPRLAASLERMSDEVLSRRGPLRSLPERVRALIHTELPDGNPSAERIAALLGISIRTLSRRLDELGSSHKALYDEVRAGLAQRYLLDERRPIGEVASLLGFSEVSAFHRAFKRWHGLSPTEYRRRAHPS